MSTALQIQHFSLPSFGLEEPYSKDVWHMKELSFYKDASKDEREKWINRGHRLSDAIDFCKFENPYLREEAKYYLYKRIKNNELHLSCFYNEENAVFFLAKYCNVCCADVYSFLDIEDKNGLIDYARENGRPVYRSQSFIGANSEVNELISYPRYITILDRVKKAISEYYGNTEDIFKKDVWDLSLLPFKVRNNISKSRKAIYFTGIVQEDIKQAAKEYCKIMLQNKSVLRVTDIISAISEFSVWLNDYDSSILDLSSVDRQIIEEFIDYLHLYSNGIINKMIMLCKFFEFLSTAKELGMYSESFRRKIPSSPLFVRDDYRRKTAYSPKPYSKDELKTINAFLGYLKDRQHERLIRVLEQTGIRINEACVLKPADLTCKNRKYSLCIHATKNDSEYVIPLSNDIANTIKKAIKESQNRYGADTVYIFAKNHDECISPGMVTRALRELTYNYELKDSTGNPLNITFHRFRHTLATMYVEMGLEPEKVSLLLGHKVNRTLKFYARIHEPDVKEAMRPYVDKMDFLLKNIDNNMGSVTPSIIPEASIPLPNGFCSQAGDKICDNANKCLGCLMFLPDKVFLAGYKAELNEIKKSIKEAKANKNDRIYKTLSMTKDYLETIIKNLEG